MSHAVLLPGAAEVERALAEVYARPELSPSPTPLRVWLGELWSFLREWLGCLLPGFRLYKGDLQLISWLVIGVLVIVVVVMLLRSGSPAGLHRPLLPLPAHLPEHPLVARAEHEQLLETRALLRGGALGQAVHLGAPGHPAR